MGLNVSSVPLIIPMQPAGVRLSYTLLLISNISTCGNQLNAETLRYLLGCSIWKVKTIVLKAGVPAGCRQPGSTFPTGNRPPKATVGPNTLLDALIALKGDNNLEGCLHGTPHLWKLPGTAARPEEGPNSHSGARANAQGNRHMVSNRLSKPHLPSPVKRTPI